MSELEKRKALDATGQPGQGAVELDGAVVPVPADQDGEVSSYPLAVMDRCCGPIAPYRPAGLRTRRLSTSLDLSVPANRIKAYRAIAGQDWRAEDVLGEELQVVDWLTVDASAFVIETGLPRSFIRSVLICEDGERVACGSDWVVSSLMSLEAFFGRAPWSPALRLAVVAQRSNAKRTFYSLDVR